MVFADGSKLQLFGWNLLRLVLMNTLDTPPHTAPVPVSAAPASPPSVHIRALITWLAIFPLVSVGMLLFAPLWGEWHPVLRSLLLTAIVVPLAVYYVVPRMMAGRAALVRRRKR